MADTTTYLSGGRIQGRSDDSLLTAIPQTSWKELDRTTLSSTSSSITVSGFAAKDNLMVLVHTLTDSETLHLKLGSGGTVDDGSNYAVRRSYDGGSDATDTSSSSGIRINDSDNGVDTFCMATIRNISSKEKLVVNHAVESNTAGGGNAPHRSEVVGKWVTSAQANVVKIIAGGTLAIGSEVVVLGCDDDEADSGTNFWQELTNTSTIGTPKVTNTTTAFTAKKYLMFTAHTSSINNSNHGNSYLRMGSSGTIDTGASYAWNVQINGGTNGTGVDYTNGMYCHDYGSSGGGDHGGLVYTGYIVNVAGKEKMVIMVAVEGNNGASNAPRRQETCGKWANTSAQANILQINTSGSSDAILAASFRVWGSD